MGLVAYFEAVKVFEAEDTVVIPRRVRAPAYTGPPPGLEKYVRIYKMFKDEYKVEKKMIEDGVDRTRLQEVLHYCNGTAPVSPPTIGPPSSVQATPAPTESKRKTGGILSKIAKKFKKKKPK